MKDPTNLLPTDPAWIKRADELCKQASRELGCMVLLMAVQPEGKLCCSVEGVPKTGPLAEMAKDVPGMLATLGYAVQLQEEFAKKAPTQ